MRTVTPKTDRYIAAVDSVVRDIVTQLRLPPDMMTAVDMLKQEMRRRPEQLPEMARLIKSILNSSDSARTKCDRIIREVGVAAGQDLFWVGMQRGAFSARLQRYPEIERSLPAILERGRRELEKL